MAVSRLRHTTQVTDGGTASIRVKVRTFILHQCSHCATEDTEVRRVGSQAGGTCSCLLHLSTAPQKQCQDGCSLAVTSAVTEMVKAAIAFAPTCRFPRNTPVMWGSHPNCCLTCHHFMLVVLCGEANLSGTQFFWVFQNYCEYFRNGAKSPTFQEGLLEVPFFVSLTLACA